MIGCRLPHPELQGLDLGQWVESLEITGYWHMVRLRCSSMHQDFNSFCSPFPPHVGCDFNTCFSDTWALNLVENSPEWQLLLDPENRTENETEPFPEGRFTTAGGVYPGESELWLSMGNSNSGRRLSDTWVFELNFTNGISGKTNSLNHSCNCEQCCNVQTSF